MSPTPARQERGPNERLGHWLWSFHDRHANGHLLDDTLTEQEIPTGRNIRRADRAIWVGLGRVPREVEVPAVIVEFVSAGKRNWLRGYETKRDEYMEIGVRQYWIFNRFEKTMTVFTKKGGNVVKRVFRAKSTFKSELLPGFELSLAKMFAVADRYPEKE